MHLCVISHISGAKRMAEFILCSAMPDRPSIFPRSHADPLCERGLFDNVHLIFFQHPSWSESIKCFCHSFHCHRERSRRSSCCESSVDEGPSRFRTFWAERRSKTAPLETVQVSMTNAVVCMCVVCCTCLLCHLTCIYHAPLAGLPFI